MAHVADHLSVVELEERYRTRPDACSARHYQAIWLLAQGHTIEETAETTCFVPRWIEELLARYNAIGPQALGDLRRNNGAPPSVLKPELLAKLKVPASGAAAGWRFVDERQGRTLDGRRTRPSQSWRAARMGSAQGDWLVDPVAASQEPAGRKRRGGSGL